METSLGEYLKTLRREVALSQEEVARAGGVSQAYIAKIEQGKRQPSAAVLKKLAPVYNVPLSHLFKAAGYWDEDVSQLTEGEEVDMAFRLVMNDLRRSGRLTTEVKKSIVRMYETATGRKFLH